MKKFDKLSTNVYRLYIYIYIYIYICVCVCVGLHLGFMGACMSIHIYTNTHTHTRSLYNLGYHDLNPQNYAFLAKIIKLVQKKEPNLPSLTPKL